MRCIGIALSSRVECALRLPVAVFVMLTACVPPAPEEDTDDVLPPGDGDALVQAPGGAFVDTQCRGKHERHDIASFTDGGAKYTRAGDVETFEHLDTSCNRVEIDTNDHYKTGRHEFTGDVRLGQVTGQTVLQIFDATRSGPIIMIRGYGTGGGTLRKLAGSVTLAAGIAGEWVNIRVVHDLDDNKLETFVNGARRWSGSGGRGGGFNLKYGNYGTGAPTKVQWRNARW
jgi:hypothetical protein